jgi:hypothetical protein
MAKLPSKRWLFEQIEQEEMRRLGLQMTDDKLANNVDMEIALHDRVRLLSSHGWTSRSYDGKPSREINC